MKMYEDLIRTTPDEHIYSDHTYDNVDIRNSFKNPFKRKTKRRLIVVIVVIVIVAVTIIFTALLLAKEKLSNTLETTDNQQTTSSNRKTTDTDTSVTLSGMLDVNCITGWITTFGLRSCYLFSNDHKDWIGAQSGCRKLGGSLTDIETNNELNFLDHRVRSTLSVYWIGGTDNGTEGKFRWEPSGQPFNVTKWNPGEPNNVGNIEDCVYYYQQDGATGWNDANCNSKFSYICEIEHF
ncbi:perlucin-like protein isoform X1 [Mytilus galloprovincialis]|uniref:perlucin-like protein isoform X1 n=1 Tax=Mytilus galloprovincialis TaxID=29158 RepID=UPI003F7CB444